MRKLSGPKLECDRRTLLIVFALTVVGASLVASSSSYFSAAEFSDPYFLLKKHLVRIMISLLFLILALRIDYRLYRRVSPVILGVAVATLIGVFVTGQVIRGATSWILIKPLGFVVQPSEFARMALILFLAYWIARSGPRMEDLVHGYLPAMGAVLVVVGLVAAERDLGTAVATTAIAFIMLYLGGARVVHLAGTAGVLAAATTARILSAPYLRDRFAGYFNRGEHLADVSWQAYQSLISLGSGGILGVGFGGSRQKLDWLPDSHTDFIFSILGEEAGLVGTVAVSLLFLLFVLRALKISTRSGDPFGEILVLGVASSIFVYAALNMLVATALIPVTGLPLPFLSYGGSALVVNAYAVGVLLNVSKKTSNRGANYLKRYRRDLLEKEAACGS
jgi:cell division protein FtsW